MPKKHRLRGSDLRTGRPSRRVHGALFSAALLPLPRSAATVVVAKTVARRAVDRNLLKRRARAALREHLGALPGGVVLTAKKGAAEASYDAIERDIAALVARLR